MGAWGCKVFEDDSALDAIEELMEAGSVVKEMEKRFKQAVKSDYLEYDDAHFVLVSAVIIDSVVNGNTYFDPDDEYLQWVLTLKKKDFEPLKAKAAEAITRVLADDSELRELWEENEGEYDSWRNDKLDIQKRLK